MRLRPVVLSALFLAGIPAFAQFTVISQPTAAYTSGTTLMTIPGANFSTTSSLTDGIETLTFSNTVDVRTVPGGGWATWGSPPNTEGNTPKVLAITTGLTSFTITLGVPQNTFGFELEPNSGTQVITATYFNGGTVLGTITQTIVGTAGALLSAASAGSPITSVILTVPAGASGFAMARFRYGPQIGGTVGTPALSTSAFSLLTLAMLAAGSLLARRENIDGRFHL